MTTHPVVHHSLCLRDNYPRVASAPELRQVRLLRLCLTFTASSLQLSVRGDVTCLRLRSAHLDSVWDLNLFCNMALDIIVAPSILSADFARLADESARMEKCGADYLHIDCMDGHFVPNLTIGPTVVKSLRKHTPLYLDCHLMVSNPGQWVDELAAAGANGVTFHIESFCEAAYDKDEPGPYGGPKTEAEIKGARALAEKIRALGMNAGLALRPRTPIAAVKPLLDEGLIDMLLAMTVEPGFGGQNFMESVMDKVGEARKMYPTLAIEVDGGISPKTVAKAVNAGANVLVAGSAIFGAEDAKEVIDLLRKAE